MLYWHFRNIQCISLALFRPKLKSPTDILTLSFWANPFDSDWLSSVQAGRFFTYTDAARWELAVRAGFLKPAFKNRWVVILGGQKIMYRRPLKIFRKFQITMQFVGWDTKWIYAAHVFRQGSDVKCVSFSKIGLRARAGLVNPNSAFAAMGHIETKPPPVWVLRHFQEDLESVQAASKALPVNAVKNDCFHIR